MNQLKEKPLLSIAQIFYMSFGFMGIQFGFALQNGNASGILQNYGAHVEQLSWFWLVAPLTGMIVQPIIGYFCCSGCFFAVFQVFFVRRIYFNT